MSISFGRHPTLRTLARHQTAAAVATALDFGLMILAVELLAVSASFATLFGAGAGATLNFWLGRRWVFCAQGERPGGQAARYFAVAAGSAALNAGSEEILWGYLGWPYVAARVVGSFMIGIAYNYPMQRAFVFRRDECDHAEPTPDAA